VSTLKDVAKLAGVHPSVISRVINNNKDLNIKPATRERILSAVKELNYRPNLPARNLKNSETKMLGMAVPDFYNPVYASVIHGAEDQAANEGYNLFLFSMKQKGMEKNYFSSLQDGQIDGLLIANSISNDPEVLELKQTNKPFVLVNRFISGINNYVVLNDERGGEIATEHLINLGHTRIANITGPLYTSTGLARFQGFRKRLKKGNITFNPSYVQESEHTQENGYISMKKLLELPEPPTAVFVANIIVCLGALEAIYDHGLSIPDDISIISIHDTYVSSSLNPPLTTIKMPLYEMGQKAVKQLILLIKSGQEHGSMLENASIVIRKSTSVLRRPESF